MSLWSLNEARAVLGGTLSGDGEVVPIALSMDSRSLRPGSCFLAIRGQRDGHGFAAQAVEQGASSLLVDHELPFEVPQLIVPDTLAALHRWGQARLEAARPRVVFAVTGSVGKTSTKELLAAATGAWKTPGNRNNTLGVPEALATLPAGLEAAVLEMGMSTPFEIARLTELAPPDFGLITNIGTAHMENFPDGQEGIARAKGELVAGLRPGGTWVHLAQDSWCRWVALQPWAARSRAVPVGPGASYGWTGEVALGPHGQRFTLQWPDGDLEIRLRLGGAHQVRNAALAATLALLAGFEPARIARGLALVEPEPGRGRLHPLGQGGWLLDESYNASPDSIMACAKALLALDGGEAVAVLGCMRELGPASDSLHRETGEGLRALGLDRVLVYGDQAESLARGFGAGAKAFPDFQALSQDPEGLSAIPAGARVLVKGSRYWAAEQAVAWLLEQR
jgi:UDP-N-acetylmuramoyl-tripeptide--D-alanyl-D-alanine ligase